MKTQMCRETKPPMRQFIVTLVFSNAIPTMPTPPTDPFDSFANDGPAEVQG